MVKFLQEIWAFFTGKQGTLKVKEDKTDNEEKEEDEINLALQSIMRIMMLIIAVRNSIEIL